MDYEDACEVEVSREEARIEIARHADGESFETFLEEVGDRPFYKGQEVLDWLGY